MNIEIINSPEDPDRLCAASALVSTNKESPKELYDVKIEEKGKKFLKHLIDSGHHSPLEHANFTISFSGVSVLFEQFLIEHRLASYTVRSRRYVDFSQSGYVVPDFFQENSNFDYSSFMEYFFDFYRELTDAGVPEEDARYILPYSFKSNIVATLNVRELGRLIYDCLEGRGFDYSEFEKIGEKILALAKDEAPILFDDFTQYGTGTNDKEEELNKLIETSFEKDFEKREVKLLSHTPNPEHLVAKTALIKHNQAKGTELEEMLSEEKEKEIISTILDNKRMRELEQVNFTFRINGISLPALTHYTRHRIWSPLIPSFTELNWSDKHIVPKSVREEGLEDKFSQAFEKAKSFREKIEKSASEEDLAYTFLPGNLTDFVVTVNARELYHIFCLRCCERAQWETREVALKMLKEVKKIAPNIFDKAGASCAYLGFCPEGKMFCGDLRTTKDYNFKKIDQEIDKIYRD